MLPSRRLVRPAADDDFVICFKVFHYYHLLLCRANFAWYMHRRNREKRNNQEHHEKTNFFVLFFEKMSSLLLMLLVLLFIHVEKRSNSLLQMFFKTGVLKNFAIPTGKHLCWSLFLIKLQE